MRQTLIPNNREDSDVIVAWVSDAIEEPAVNMRQPYGMGVVDDGEIELGVVLCDYTGHNILMHFAKRNGAMVAPRTYGDLLRVPFNDPINVKRVTGFVNERNEKSRDLLRVLGFSQEGRIRRHFGDSDALIFGLLKEEFEESRYGQ